MVVTATPIITPDVTTVMQQDIIDIIATIGEDVEVYRKSKAWSSGKATISWELQGVISGEWQPVSGTVRYEEQGMSIQSTATLFTAVDVDVQDDDRVTRIADASIGYVNYIKKYDDHWEIMLKKDVPG